MFRQKKLKNRMFFNQNSYRVTSAITQYQQCYTSSEAKLNAGSENFGFKFLGVIGKKRVAYF